MNARARILIQSELSFDNFMHWLCSWQTLAAIAMMITLFATAISVIYVKDQYRQLTNELQSLQATNTRLHVQREQLLLEEGTWLAQSRVRHIAGQRLGMHSPKQVKRLMIAK